MEAVDCEIVGGNRLLDSWRQWITRYLEVVDLEVFGGSGLRDSWRQWIAR